MESVRVRFAPSPTGMLHIGGARTALFNWLFARHAGGVFVLRIEDTDRARNTAEATQAIYDGLRWLGLGWDEGPEVGGGRGPYFQSGREGIYAGYLKRLEEAGRVYEEGGAVRFRFARERVTVRDLICGDVEIDMADPETNPDMTIRRPDGSWIFHFVNVVDDIEMGITHVIRGEDHLSNTPKHLQLYGALGVEAPRYGHIPLILNKDGSKMSKRDAGASVGAYVEMGYLPEAVRNYLCLLGWSPKDDREKMDIAEVTRIFDLKNVNRKNATFDLEKCTWLNGEYMKEVDGSRFEREALAALGRAGIEVSTYPREYVRGAIETCRGKLRTFGEIGGYAGFYFRKEVEYDAEAAGKQFTAENRPRVEAVRRAFAELGEFNPKSNVGGDEMTQDAAPLGHEEEISVSKDTVISDEWPSRPADCVSSPRSTSVFGFNAGTIEGALKGTAAALGVKVGALVHPTRLALTGAVSGPSLYHLIEVLGREETLRRMDAALEQFPA